MNETTIQIIVTALSVAVPVLIMFGVAIFAGKSLLESLMSMTREFLTRMEETPQAYNTLEAQIGRINPRARNVVLSLVNLYDPTSTTSTLDDDGIAFIRDMLNGSEGDEDPDTILLSDDDATTTTADETLYGESPDEQEGMKAIKSAA